MWTMLLAAAFVADPAAEDFMRQVAAKWEAAESGRRSYVYSQRVRSSLVRGSKAPCKDDRRYDVLPGESRTEKHLISSNRVCDGGELDQDLLDDLTEDLTDDKESRDGIPRRMFPLQRDDLSNYHFRFAGDANFGGRQIRKVAFSPRPGGERPWKGEIWVDAEDLQPVRMTSDLAKKIPMGVRVFLGTDVKQLGFSATYTRVAPGIWFPATYGTEFQIKVLFGFRRTITLSMESGEFRRTETESRIRYDDGACPPDQISCANP